MKIGATRAISHPAQKTFEVLRDQQAELAQRYLPNIDSVEVLEREENPPHIRLYNRWQGSTGEVAKVIRPFISRELTCWFDDATWDSSSLSCQWRIQSAKAKEVFECSGSTRIVPEGDDRCTFELVGELQVHPEKVPGVPGFLARKVREPIEKFVSDCSNLTSR
jgi:hypothetical protein